MDVEDTPPGLESLDAGLAMGNLSIAWPYYELRLFNLFSSLLGAGAEKAQIIWFSLVSLDIRLRLMRKLAAVAGGEKREQILEAIGKAEGLSRRRNELVHWVWAADEGEGDEDGNFVIRNLRHGQDEIKEVSGKVVRQLREDVREQEALLLALTSNVDDVPWLFGFRPRKGSEQI